MRYGSVCSGIEAATVAWHPLGWKAAWFAEIEPFPSTVLAHHYPDVPNLGDMTKIAERIRAGEVQAPDVLVGGTPCQAFSVAGMRGGLSDARGALTISFVELADEIDRTRIAAGNEPCTVVWENVPGVLSSKDNAFGCFLGALAGEADALQPPGGKWANAGYVRGPQRTIAWRILDAQYFGVAQRRRRVFVVASAGARFDPAAVLFEFEGGRRDSAPRREAGEETAGTLASRTGAGGFQGTDEACSGYVQPVAVALRGRDGGATAELGDDVSFTPRACSGGGDKPHVIVPVAFGGNNTSGPIDVSPALNACGSASGRLDFESEAFLVQPVAHVETMPAITCGGGHAASHNQTSGQMRGQYILPVLAFDILGTPASEVAKPTDVHTPLRARTPGQFENSTVTVIAHYYAVRRLIPMECERLQAFPDGYTLVPVRGKPAADGPRYKSLGNSMCVNVMHWIGKRLDRALRTAVPANDNKLNATDVAA
ncbi:DNA cytosine methyltransferase [Microvirga sp. 17 mud 1-3]|nr:DNA cytosine methyltransferase [Microvirga sp. 17 mud 1-3]